MLLLDAEPLAAAVVGAGVVQFDHLALVVDGGATFLLDGLLEADAAVDAFQLKGCFGQLARSRAPGLGSRWYGS